MSRLFLKEHREAKGMSGRQVSAALGIALPSLYRFESEAWTRANPKKLQAYANALGINPSELWYPPRRTKRYTDYA